MLFILYHVEDYFLPSTFLLITEKTVRQGLCVLISECIDILLLKRENVNKRVFYFLIHSSIYSSSWRNTIYLHVSLMEKAQGLEEETWSGT